MIPLRDSTPSRTFPIMTVLLILANVYVFVRIWSAEFISPEEMFYIYGIVPAELTGGQGYITLLTSMFMHGGWMHLIGNMWILWLFGDNVEDRMGSLKFVLFYLICGLIAGLTHYIVNPFSTVPVVGASGAVAGVMGAYFVMFKRARILTFVPPIFLFNLPAWIYLGFWAVSQVYCGAVDFFAANGCGQIAFFAHVGGFLAGMLLYKFFLIDQYNYQR